MTTDTRDALLPCPFCGGVVEMHHPKGGAYNDITYLLCDSCGAVCSFRPNLKGSKAMAAWNCRTPRTEDARDGAVAELACAAKAMVDPPLRYVGATIEIECGDHATAMQVVARVRAAIAALTQPEAK